MLCLRAKVGVEQLLRRPYHACPKNEMWRTINTTPNFWEGLQWMPDGRVLWDYVQHFNPILLTSPGIGTTQSHNHTAPPLCSRLHAEPCAGQGVAAAVRGKHAWAARHIQTDRVICEFKKEKYAMRNAVLIDDREKNIIPWRAAGGIGVHHVSAAKTIRELEALGFQLPQ